MTPLLILLMFSPAFAAEIEGEVQTGSNGRLQRSAIVLLMDGDRIVKETSTGLDGKFEFMEVLPGTYRIRVAYTGFADPNLPVTVKDEKARVRVPMTLKPLDVAGNSSAEVIASDEWNVPRDALREYEEGLALRRKGDCAAAVRRLQRAIALYDRYGSAWDELGLCFRQMGRLAEAEQHFRKAIRHSSAISPPINLTNLLLSSGRARDAQEVAEAAIRFNPTEGDLFYALARTYSDQGKTREAEQAALEAHSRSHRIADVHLLLAKIYLETGNTPALAAQLEMYLIENPTGPAAAQARATLLQLRDSENGRSNPK